MHLKRKTVCFAGAGALVAALGGLASLSAEGAEPPREPRPQWPRPQWPRPQWPRPQWPRWPRPRAAPAAAAVARPRGSGQRSRSIPTSSTWGAWRTSRPRPRIARKPLRSRATSLASSSRPTTCGRCTAQGVNGQGPDDRDRRPVRLPDDPAAISDVRQDVRPSRAAAIQGHPAGRHGPLRRDQSGRRLGGRDHLDVEYAHTHGPGREHPAGRDADLGERGDDRLPADRRRPRST